MTEPLCELTDYVTAPGFMMAVKYRFTFDPFLAADRASELRPWLVERVNGKLGAATPIVTTDIIQQFVKSWKSFLKSEAKFYLNEGRRLSHKVDRTILAEMQRLFDTAAALRTVWKAKNELVMSNIAEFDDYRQLIQTDEYVDSGDLFGNQSLEHLGDAFLQRLEGVGHAWNAYHLESQRGKPTTQTPRLEQLADELTIIWFQTTGLVPTQGRKRTSFPEVAYLISSELCSASNVAPCLGDSERGRSGVLHGYETVADSTVKLSTLHPSVTISAADYLPALKTAVRRAASRWNASHNGVANSRSPY